MRFVADENVDGQIVEALRAAGHGVLSIAELTPGVTDPVVLKRGVEERSILLTADKDFGELVYRRRMVTAGVVLLRLAGAPAEVKVARVIRVVAEHGLELRGSFTVVTAHNVRIRRHVP